MLEVILKRFEKPDEVRNFEKGKFEVVHIGGMTIGRATYEPGWRWSEHVGPSLGKKSCDVGHVGLVVSGRATAAIEGGTVIEMKPGDIFFVPAGLLAMTAGLWATSLTCLCTCSGRAIIQRRRAQRRSDLLHDGQMACMDDTVSPKLGTNREQIGNKLPKNTSELDRSTRTQVVEKQRRASILSGS
jgi:hypothetical protein